MRKNNNNKHSVKNIEVLNGWVTCQDPRTSAVRSDHLLGWVSLEVLTPYLISSSQQLSKVLLSSLFHRGRNWDSERLSNLFRVSQQPHGTGKSQGFSLSATCCCYSCCYCNVPTILLPTVYHSMILSRNLFIVVRVFSVLERQCETFHCCIWPKLSWLGNFPP